MKKLLLFLSICANCKSFAVETGDYASLVSAAAQAHVILGSCILVPTPDPTCPAQLTTYYATLATLNLPLPLSKPTDGYISPYSTTPYDICAFDTARIAVADLCPPQ